MKTAPPFVACLLLASVGATLAPGPGRADGLARVVEVTEIGALTGAGSINATDAVNVYGTDLGSMFATSDGRIGFLFGDTFGPPGTPDASGDWRSNVLAFATDRDASDGIRFDGWITDAAGRARALVEGDHDPNDGLGEVTKIPSCGWSTGSRMYLWFMSVSRWGDPGLWNCGYAAIAYSDDGGSAWTVSGARWSGTGNFVQAAVAAIGDRLHVWGIPAGRFGGVQLARVPESSALDTTAYELRTTTGWTSDPAAAATVVPPPVGETSVIWNRHLRRWILTYLDETTHAILLRQAPEPWGPWSDPFTLADAATYPALYGAFMHPAYTEGDGRSVYFLMSRWFAYNVFLMRAVLERSEAPDAALIVEESAGSTAVATGGVRDTYTVRLGQEPSADVTVQVSAPAGLTASPATVLFTADGWNEPATITLDAIDAAVPPGTSTAAAAHASTSTDPYYDGYAGPTVAVTLHNDGGSADDEDVAEVRDAAGEDGTAEGGPLDVTSDGADDGGSDGGATPGDAGDGCSCAVPGLHSRGGAIALVLGVLGLLYRKADSSRSRRSSVQVRKARCSTGS